MSQKSDDRELLTRYFLGVASAAEREAVEEKYFAVDSEIETFLLAEDEVIDDYVRGSLTTSERALFEKNFLCTSGRRQRLEFTMSLVEALAGSESGEFSASAQEAPGVELFDSLLAWLDPVSERAAEKFETIRSKLIRMFASRGCVDAEGLADQTIDRVSLRFTQLKQTYVGDPASYFYGVARGVFLESLGASAAMMPKGVGENIESASADNERVHSCLQKCLEQLSDRNRELILQFYGLEKKAKTGARKELAQSLGISSNALRIRAHRIRTSLQKCVTSCLEESE